MLSEAGGAAGRRVRARRVGKTECLRRFCEGKPCVWYSCSRDTDALQLQGFSRRLLARDPSAARFIDAFASWQDAFEEIPRLDIPGRKLVVIDEFPYAVAGNGALPSILQNTWDETLSREDVMIVLCGSSISFMEDELLSEKNPLYGRATGIWKMLPLEYADAVGFFPNYTPQEKLEAYGILGGVFPTTSPSSTRSGASPTTCARTSCGAGAPSIRRPTFFCARSCASPPCTTRCSVR